MINILLFLLAISWGGGGGGGGGGGSWVSLGGGGKAELFGGEASPAPPSLDETLTFYIIIYTDSI